jgi:nucleoside-diphosphate-sugar epimerase
MDKISVFGGTGFVGSCFSTLYRDRVILIPREDRDPQSKDVLYLISTTDNYNVFDDVHKDIDTNLSVLVEVLKNLKPGESVFNFVSSWFVYGDGVLPATEESYCNPKGFYSITKRCAEQLVESYCKTFEIKYRILRLCNIYGKGDQGVSKKKNAFQYLIERMKHHEPIDLYHGGNIYRDYMHIKDTSRAIGLVLEQGDYNTIYNIGTGNKVLFKDMIDIAFKETRSNSVVEAVCPPPFHLSVQVKDFFMEAERLKALGFRPEISLNEGIKELCQ